VPRATGFSQLGVLDVAGTRLPGLVEIFNAPTLHVALDNLVSLAQAGDGVVGQKQPLDAVKACGPLFTRQDCVDG
jgi:hypothetical protein